MKVFGLTGGIASGKSTVAGMLGDLGAIIIDADMIARQVVEPGKETYEKIKESFGEEILLPDGGIDRRKLRRIVFTDKDKRALLDSLVHPAVMKETASQLKNAAESGVEVVIYEAALLVETGLYLGFDGLIVVKCDREHQKSRLKKRDNVTSNEVASALASQSSTEEKIKLANYIIDNGKTLGDTLEQVTALWEIITSMEEGDIGSKTD